jgi:hypothetical protein
VKIVIRRRVLFEFGDGLGNAFPGFAGPVVTELESFISL